MQEVPKGLESAAVTQLVRALEQKDGGATAHHSQRTAEHAVRIARELPAMTEELVERVRLAAVLHDMGKLAIEERILGKRSALEDAEWDEMRRHPELGYDLVGDLPGLEDVALGVLFHHERWDGQGYPRGLAGEHIPWIARLIAVADSYDAMVSTRPYRIGASPAEAYAEILRQSGAQFDPKMAEAFGRAFAQEAASSVSVQQP